MKTKPFKFSLVIISSIFLIISILPTVNTAPIPGLIESSETDDNIPVAATAGYKTIVSPGWGGDGNSIQDWVDGLRLAGFDVVDLSTGQAAAGLHDANGDTSEAVSYEAQYTNTWYTSLYAHQLQQASGWYSELAVSDTSQEGPICPSALPSSPDYLPFKFDLESGDNLANDPATGEIVVRGQGIFQIGGMVYEQICRTAGGVPGSTAWNNFFGNGGKFNYVTHSMGGLVCRTLIKYYGLGPYMQTIVNVQAPHWGVPFGNWVESIAESISGIPILEKAIYSIGTGLIGAPSASAWDMRCITYGTASDHAYLDELDTDKDGIPEVEDYPEWTGAGGWYTIAGVPDPSIIYSNLPGFDMNEWEVDGVNPTGFDALVPQDGAWMGGSTKMITTDNHATARNNAQTINKIAACLGIPANVPGATDRIVGDVRIAIDGFASTIEKDSINPGDGDPYYKIWVAEEGGAWTYLGEVNPGVDLQDVDGYFEGDSTTQAPGIYHLSGNTRWISVMVEVWDDDSPWSDQYWETFTIHGICLSEDIDKIDNYYARVQDGNDYSKIWISPRGFTTDLSQCFYVRAWVDKVYYSNDYDPWPKGAGEEYLKIWAGPGDNAFYTQTGIKSRSGSGYLTWNVVGFDGYMLKTDPFKFRIEGWEEDSFSDDQYGTLNYWANDITPFANGGTWGWSPYSTTDIKYWAYFTVSPTT